MKIIQLILVPLLIVLVVLYFKRFRTKLFDRGIVLFIGSSSVLMVLFPDLTQKLADAIGVGRGVDLVTYFGLVGLAFVNVLLFAKTRELETRLTDVVRRQAIHKAEPPDK